MKGFSHLMQEQTDIN